MRFCLDRIEGDMAICLLHDKNTPHRSYEFPLSRVNALEGLADGTLFDAELDSNGLPRNIQVLTELTEATRARNKARLQALFARSKKKDNTSRGEK